MTTFTVLYRWDGLKPADAPYAFVCEADDGDHAEEQCLDAYPTGKVVWVVETGNTDDAYADYWGARRTLEEMTR